MTAYVLFFTPRGIGGSAPGMGPVRICEHLSVPGTTTATVRDGEAVIVVNEEAGGVMVAHGSTPDGAAVASTAATSAGIPVHTGQYSVALMPDLGAKINVKTLT